MLIENNNKSHTHAFHNALYSRNMEIETDFEKRFIIGQFESGMNQH